MVSVVNGALVSEWVSWVGNEPQEPGSLLAFQAEE